jgi:hypothetical protein
MNLEDFCFLVSKKTKSDAKKDNYSLDILTIITIANIVMKIIKLLHSVYGCTNTTATALNKMGPVVRFILWRSVRKNLKGKKEREYLLNSLKKCFKETSEENILMLINEQIGEKK